MKFFKIISLLLLLQLTACQSINIEGDGTPDRHGLAEIVHSSYYGFNWSKYDEAKSSNMQGLYAVRVSDTYLNALVGVISLGLYKPIIIEYWTAEKIAQNEKEEAWEGGLDD